ncbi:hypothetical protein AB1N83_007852 [Pleurotus pulmonarius]
MAGGQRREMSIEARIEYGCGERVDRRVVDLSAVTLPIFFNHNHLYIPVTNPLRSPRKPLNVETLKLEVPNAHRYSPPRLERTAFGSSPNSCIFCVTGPFISPYLLIFVVWESVLRHGLGKVPPNACVCHSFEGISRNVTNL